MKKLLVSLTVILTCVAAFGQGKIDLINNSVHMVYFAPAGDQTANFGLATADQSLTGQAIPTGTLPSSVKLVAELWAGTSSSALSLYSSTYVGSTTAGIITEVKVLLNSPFIAGNALAYFQVQIHDNASGDTSYAVAKAGNNMYYGESGIYSVTTSSTPAYNQIVNAGSPANSTWTAGTYAMPVVGTTLTGSTGSIEIGMNLVPEPTSFALLGLGAASLMIFRRRQ